MIENAVASTLMRLPVAELSALRKIFKASPGGLSVEGFVEAMLPPGPRHVPAAVAASDSSLASISVISRLNFEVR